MHHLLFESIGQLVAISQERGQRSNLCDLRKHIFDRKSHTVLLTWLLMGLYVAVVLVFLPLFSQMFLPLYL